MRRIKRKKVLARMHSYNRIHSDRDNVVRVELNSYGPRVTRAASREPMRVTSSINRNDTFTKGDRPSNIIRSDTFILKHNSESSDERHNDYNTYSRSRRSSEKRFDDKSSYDTYTRPEKKGEQIVNPSESQTFHRSVTIFREISVHQHGHVSKVGQEAVKR